MQSAALQLVLVHAVDVLLGFHLVGGDGKSIAIVLGEGLGLARSHEHAIRIADALRTTNVARERHRDLVHKLVGARGLIHRKDAPKRMRSLAVVGHHRGAQLAPVELGIALGRTKLLSYSSTW